MQNITVLHVAYAIAAFGIVLCAYLLFLTGRDFWWMRRRKPLRFCLRKRYFKDMKGEQHETWECLFHEDDARDVYWATFLKQEGDELHIHASGLVVEAPKKNKRYESDKVAFTAEDKRVKQPPKMAN